MRRAGFLASAVLFQAVGLVPFAVSPASAQICAAPSAPGNVTAGPGNASATVSWTAATVSIPLLCEVTSYTVRSSPGTASVTVSGTTATVTGLTNGTSYTFSVVATNAGGNGPAATSNAVTPRTLPGQPSGLAGTPGNGSVSLTWLAPASDGGAPILDYTVTASPGGTQVTSTTTSAVMNALANGTAYRFTVVARNEAGTGIASEPSSAVTPRTVPGAPTAVTGTPMHQAVAVSWTAPSYDGGSPVTSYTVTASPGGATATTAAIQATIAGLANGTPYTFTVVATNAAGDGSASAESAPVTPTDSSPAAPTGISATPWYRAADVTWSQPDPTGHSEVLDYTVVASPGGASVTVAAPATAARVTGLADGTVYTFAVTARNAAGAGASSAPSNAVTTPSGPVAPGGTTATVVNSMGRVRVTWTHQDNGYPFAGFRVYQFPGDACFYVAGTAARSLELQPTGNWVYGGPVSFMVHATTVANCTTTGDGPDSVRAPDVTLPARVPGLLRDAVITSMDGAVAVSWETLGVDTHLTQYVVTANPGGISRTVSGKAVHVVLGGLTNDVTYSVSVTAYSAAGSKVSGPWNVTPRLGLPPYFEPTVHSYRAAAFSISDDGRYGLWVEGGSGTELEPYLHSVMLADRQQQVAYLLGNYGGLYPYEGSAQLSGNGRWVAFASKASLLTIDTNRKTDVYLYDRQTDALTLLATGIAGEPANAAVRTATLSPDGRYAVFSTQAGNLVAGDTNGVADVFLKDLQAGTTERVSVDTNGVPLPGIGGAVGVSADGRYVVGITGLRGFWRDRQANDIRMFGAPSDTTAAPVICGLSRDGRVVTFSGLTYPAKDGYPEYGTSTFSSVYRQEIAETTVAPIVSLSTNGVLATGSTCGGTSADGQMVMFVYGSRLWVNDLTYGRTSAVASGGYGGAIAANNRSIMVAIGAYCCSDRAAGFTEFLRTGAAGGRVWYAGWLQSVNTASGAFHTAATDVSVATAGDPIAVQRTYDSMRDRVGAFGRGWLNAYEYRLEDGPALGRVVHLPDGRVESHADSGGWAEVRSYQAPAGSTAKLTGNTTIGYTYVEKGGETVHFDPTGRADWIATPQGLRQNLTYSGRLLTKVTDIASGRALTFGWTGGRITSVTTDVALELGGALTWTYEYRGDLLTKVCAPAAADGTRCTRYVYNAYGLLAEVFNAYDERTTHVTYHGDWRVATSAIDGVNASTFAYPAPRTADITDARGFTTRHVHDQASRLRTVVDPFGKTTTLTYDTWGWPATVTDPLGNRTTTTYTSAGDKTSEVTGASSSVPGSVARTAWLTYDASRNLTEVRDKRSASSTDTAFRTRYTYDTRRNVTSETSPPLPDFPGGVTRTWTYSDGTAPALGGGTVPAGLMLTATDARGKTTTYRYASNGDLMEVETPAGLVTRYTYNALGWRTSETVVSDASPAGARTDLAYDVFGHVVEETGPASANAVTGEPGRTRVTKVHDRAGRLVQERWTDLLGTALERVTTYTVDAAGRVLTTTDNQTGKAEVREYDPVGNLAKVTDRLGRETTHTYTRRNQVETVTRRVVENGTARDVVVAVNTYDDAGRLRTETDAVGRVLRHDYDTSNRRIATTLLAYAEASGVTRDVRIEESTYDAASNVTERWTGGHTRRETFAYDALNRVTSHTLDPAGLNRQTTYKYDAEGNQTVTTATGDGRTEETRRTYDDLGLPSSETVENGATDLTTWFTHDDRGLLVARTDPRASSAGDAAYTTTFGYDEIGRPVSTTLPPVAVEQPPAAPATSRPVTYIGYDAFGQRTHDKDAAGHVTVTAFDRLGRRTRIDHPAYQRPDTGATLSPFETWTYDDEGRPATHTDRRGGVTDFVHDGLDRLAERRDPALTAERSVTAFRYDDAGRLLGTTDPTGAVTELVPDMRDRLRTSTTVLRQPGGGVLRATMTYGYDDLGNLTSAKQPTGETWTFSSNLAGERTRVIDPRAQAWLTGRDLAGRPVSETDPLNRKTLRTFDLAGRLVTVERTNAANAVVTTERAAYDAAGNVVSETGGRGFTTMRAWDATGRLTSVTDPVDATVWRTQSFGYDVRGLLTRSTDGRGHDTTSSGAKVSAAYDVTYAYNPWGLVASVVEPATSAHDGAADRTWTTSYDAGGLPVTEAQPGGIVVTRAFDAAGRLTAESGTGGGAVSAARSLGYDLGGRLTSAGHPSGTLTFGYDDAGRVVSAGGAAGTASFGYDLSGRLTTRTDASGTATFTWTNRNELDTVVDPVTGTTVDHTYDVAGQRTSTAYGAGVTRTYAYDAHGRVTDDRLAAAGGDLARLEYTYDGDGHVATQRVTTGGAADGLHNYSYDRLGRLSGWTPPSGAAVAYVWDGADNRTSAGGVAATYDERSRLVSDGAGTYAWTPRGTLDSLTAPGGATIDYDLDALGRLVTAGPSAHAYDSLDRLVAVGGAAARYSGIAIDPVAIGTALLSRDADGDLLAVSDSSGSRLVTTNRHGDAVTGFTAAGAVTGTRAYDPFGGLIASAGDVAGSLGFQGDVTDAASGLVWMGARWYSPSSGSFTARDTMARKAGDRRLMNRYGYADADPVTVGDPDGRCPATGWGGCSLDAGPASFTVTHLAGTYSDSSVALVLTPPQPAPVEASVDGLDEDELAIAEVMAARADAADFGRVGRGVRQMASTFWEVTKQTVTDMSDVVGCVKGKMGSCAWLVVGFVPGGKALKLVDAAKSAERARNVKVTRSAVERVNTLRAKANAVQSTATTADHGQAAHTARRSAETASHARHTPTPKPDDEYIDLYHGTSKSAAERVIAEGIDVSRSTGPKDFGPGFYTTKDYAQASDRARSKTSRGDIPVVLHYRVPKSLFEGLSGKTFVRGDSAFRWFTTRVRKRMHRYDYVEGPMIRNPREYFAGRSNSTFGHQISFHTRGAAAGLDKFLVGPIS